MAAAGNVPAALRGGGGTHDIATTLTFDDDLQAAVNFGRKTSRLARALLDAATPRFFWAAGVVAYAKKEGAAEDLGATENLCAGDDVTDDAIDTGSSEDDDIWPSCASPMATVAAG